MKSLQVSVLASAVGVALVGGATSIDALAGQHGAALASVESTNGAVATGRYIITFRESGLATYRGGVSGLQSTAPVSDGVSAASSRKLDVNSSASVSYRNFLATQRAAHIAAIEQQLGRALAVRYTYEITRNAISAALSPAEAAAVSRVDGVVSVKAVTLKQLETFRGPTFIGADKIWDGSAVPSYDAATRGQGVKVGVIDSGTNIGHPSFADDAACGFSAAHPKLHPKDCMTNDGTSCTGADPDADDDNGHGVHTSSTAAGNTIDNTFTPAPALPDGISMSGVAPCAEVYSYKICDAANGCADDAITAAIQNAIADQVDVINYSIGPTCGFGNPWEESLDFLAAEGADIFVAASAGNTRATCTDPISHVANNGPWMMTVAASTQDQIAAPTFSAIGPGAPPALTQDMPAILGDDTQPIASDFSGRPLRTYPTNSTACTATGGIPASTFASNEIAVIVRGSCSFTEKITNSYNAGARVILIGNNQPGGAFGMLTTGLDPAIAANVSAFGIAKEQGDALRTFVDAHEPPAPNADLIFADGFDGPAGAMAKYQVIAIGDTKGDVLAKFSFRGPTLPPYDNLTKPDITAPGVNIYAALDDAEGSYGLLSGTSMSSPHIAGSAALVRAVKPNWSPMEVKSALQTTASLSGFQEDETTQWTVDQVGSGRVDLTKAALAGLTLDETPENFAEADPNGGTVDMRDLNLASLRNTNCETSCSWTRKFKNRLNVAGTWTPTAVDPPGYHLTFNPASITVAPGFTQSITVTATATGPMATTMQFGRVDLTESNSRSPVQHLTVAVKVLPPTISAAPASLSSTQLPNETKTQTLNVTNVGGGTLNWNFAPTAVGVIWNQPKSVNSGWPSDYSTADAMGAWAAADFQVAAGGALTKLTAYGFDNTTPVVAPTSITWRIYADAAGKPAGNPNDGSGSAPVWTYTTTLPHAGVSMANGRDIILDLAAAGQSASLPPGTYWLSVAPTYPDPFPASGTSTAGPWFWFGATQQGALGMLVGDEFPLAAWTATTTASPSTTVKDFAFKVEGNTTCGAPWLSLNPTSGSATQNVTNAVTATFNSAGMAPGTYTANACIASNDSATPITIVPVTMSVTGAGCSPTQLLGDPSLENGGAPWTATDSVFGSPFCDASCGADPHTGDLFVWFGGSATAGTASLSQSVVFPSGTPRWLNYWFIDQLGGTDGQPDATFTIKVDGNVIGTVTPGTVSTTYAAKTLSIPSQYIDGNSHTLRFDYAKTGTGLRGAMIDDITLDCAAQPTGARTGSDSVATALSRLH